MPFLEIHLGLGAFCAFGGLLESDSLRVYVVHRSVQRILSRLLFEIELLGLAEADNLIYREDAALAAILRACD